MLGVVTPGEETAFEGLGGDEDVIVCDVYAWGCYSDGKEAVVESVALGFEDCY